MVIIFLVGSLGICLVLADGERGGGDVRQGTVGRKTGDGSVSYVDEY